LLQWVLESITGESYTDLLKKYIPSWSKSFIEHAECTIGYGRNIKPSTPWTATTFTGSTGVKANLLEVMTLAKSFLNTTEDMAKSLLEIGHMKVRNQNGYVARGWQAFPLPKDKYAYYHTGRTDGHYSFVAIKPDTQTAVVVLANSAVGADLLGINILRMMNENWRRK
jgi:CubicO group peptidase (beta-lactamase class C family)